MELTVLSDFLEAMTIFCFGISWPISIRKSWISKTSKGKSLFFEIFVLIGYAVGIIRKILQIIYFDSSGFIFFLSYIFYILNFIMISIDTILYFRNSKFDKKQEKMQS